MGNVQSIAAGLTAFISRLAHDDTVFAIGRSDDGGVAVGAEQWCVIARAKLEALRIKDCHVGIKHGLTEANGFHLCGQALAFF